MYTVHTSFFRQVVIFDKQILKKTGTNLICQVRFLYYLGRIRSRKESSSFYPRWGEGSPPKSRVVGPFIFFKLDKVNYNENSKLIIFSSFFWFYNYIVYNKKCVSACYSKYVAMLFFCDTNHMFIRIDFFSQTIGYEFASLMVFACREWLLLRYHKGREVVNNSVVVMFSLLKWRHRYNNCLQSLYFL